MSSLTIGIIGGGQLGRMLAMAAARLGLKTIILDPANNAPAFQCANEAIIASYDDESALSELESKCDFVTYEFENVPVSTLASLNASGKLAPNSTALETSQDRLTEKAFFNGLGIATAPFEAINSVEELQPALDKLGGRGILKTRRLGYDGKGQVRLSAESDENFIEAETLIASTDCILEGFVDFEREISIIAARNRSGEIQCYDPAENVHRDGILFTSTVPARISRSLHNDALDIATKTLTALDYVGIMGIEFFALTNGELVVNEFAPRVHNSGHWTEAACAISQFEQHMRAVANFALGNTERHSNCHMQNLIGDEIDQIPELAKKPNVLVHAYGKAEARPGRKMGHYTEISPK